MGGGTRMRYRAALSGWALGGVAAPLAMTAALIGATALICEGGGECSWGLELVLVLPVLLTCFFVSGPRLVGRFMQRQVDDARSQRAMRITRIGAAASLALLFGAPALGLVGALLVVVGVTLGVPWLVARSTR